jgi:hypothetical protein
MSDPQAADAVARRRALLIVVIVALTGGLAIWSFAALRPAIEEWVASGGDVGVRVRRFRIVLLGLWAFVSLPLVAFAVYFWRLGRRILLTGRFPPPGMSVVRDTPILTGAASRRGGRALQFVGLALAAAAIGFGVVLWRLASLLTQSPAPAG